MIEMDIEAWLILYLKKYQFCYRMMSIGNNEIKNKVDYIYFHINTARTTPKLASSFFVPEDSGFATLKKKGVFGWAVAVDKFFLSYGL